MGKETGLVTGNKARNLVHQSGENLTTTSLIVAEVFHKQHGHVIRDIEKLEIPEDVRLSNFGQSSYINDQGKSQPMYEISKDGFTLLAMGFTGKKAMEFKLKFLAEFNRMEQEIRRRKITPSSEISDNPGLEALAQNQQFIQALAIQNQALIEVHQKQIKTDQALAKQGNQINALALTQDEELCLTADQEKTLYSLMDRLISARSAARKLPAGSVAPALWNWIKQRTGTRAFKGISRARYPVAVEILRTQIAREEAEAGQTSLKLVKLKALAQQ